jgi:excisionase family DNA binding protein
MAKYQRKTRLFPIALSVNGAAEAMSLPRRKLRDAIRDGHLIAYQNGTHVRVLVEDLVAWVKTTWTQI